jgi:hypothetical protein
VPALPVAGGAPSLFAQAPTATAAKTRMIEGVDMASSSATFDVPGRRNLRFV